MPSIIAPALVYVLLLQSVTADSGDDFSNNLFTDLSPVLALFGERVTMQFLSQCMGWSECIILAAGPLGILTMIVAAIRVGGPPWLKALVGRATENIATAELELMSSTSNEVCELWNGKDVVRCTGSAPLWEFICLVPSRGTPENPVVRILEIQEASDYIQRNYYSAPNNKTSLWGTMQKHLKFFGNAHEISQGNLETPSQPTKEVILVRNSHHPAPNISHNRTKNTGRSELYFAACLGIALQAGVIVYSGLITQYSRIAPGFQKDEKPVGTYAFPLVAVGTVILNMGIFMCSHMVESSTKEEIYTPVEGWRARLVWLQGEKTVGDQEFKSFALFTGEDQPRIITSSRVAQDQTAAGRDTLFSLVFKTVAGAIISLIGFLAQFIGTRGMHWSASIASLIAISIMTALRAWVRRRLTTPILSEPLIPGFELDWFANTFKDLKDADWYKSSDHNTTDEAVSFEARSNASTTNGDPRLEAKDFDIVDAQDVCAIRQRLAKLVARRSPVSQEAVAVTKAIEATMSILAQNDDSLHADSYHNFRYS
ncbi:hypothetical protein MKX08_005795 [Trichoderma sp. CBMAI-0020]|nr:hypothetical protein MKX08_005795 [Trichoderma sp. CBMAI-0020]WOD46151.1 hypothetical protein [Trichoderma atroviride]